jgi:hypothetical protein
VKRLLMYSDVPPERVAQVKLEASAVECLCDYQYVTTGHGYWVRVKAEPTCLRHSIQAAILGGSHLAWPDSHYPR